MDKRRCRYCYQKLGDPTAVVRHTVLKHAKEQVVLLWGQVGETERTRYQTKTFDVRGVDIKCSANDIHVDAIRWKLFLPSNSSTESPAAKVTKINTPSQCKENVFRYKEKSDDGNYDLEGTVDMEDILVNTSELMVILTRLKHLLPAVTEHLKVNGCPAEWIAFFELVNANELNLNNIDIRLFWDVVKFYECGNIHGMRFSSEVKQFWSIGLQLWLLRSLGQQVSNPKVTKRELDSLSSNINFERS